MENNISLDNSKRRFFIALLPPEKIQKCTQEFKDYFTQTYDSRGAQNSPPHITLQPPFEWQWDNVTILEQCVQTFADTWKVVPVTLKGFGAFEPRVVYINVVKTPELMTLQKDLMAYMKASLGIVDRVSESRAFVPHMTVAFRDLTKKDFYLAWKEFEHRPLDFEFTAFGFSLLIHDGKRWNVSKFFRFLGDG
jgi:2'-5' RNA ligase